MATFPHSLCGIRQDGHGEQHMPMVLRSDMERGIPKQRRSGADVLVRVPCSLVFRSAADAAAFESWFYAEGMGWFDFTLPRTGAVVQARIIGGDIGTLSPLTPAWNASERSVVLEYVRPAFVTLAPGLHSVDASRILSVQRNSTATYIDDDGVLQIAPANVVRYQGGQLLVDGEGTNLLRQSAGMVASPWAGSMGSEATGQADPFGGTAATQLNSTSLAHTKIQDFSTSGIFSVCLSMFFKSAGVAGNNARLLIYNVTTAAIICHVTVDAGTGVVKASTGTGAVTSVGSLGSGWFRFGIGTANFTSGHTLRAYVYPDAVTATASLLVFGGQAEAGLVPTSYIPTTTAAATRAADIITVAA